MKDLITDYMVSRLKLMKYMKKLESRQTAQTQELQDVIWQHIDKWPHWLRAESMPYVRNATIENLSRLFFAFGAYLETSDDDVGPLILDLIREAHRLHSVSSQDMSLCRSMLNELDENIQRMNSYCNCLYEVDPVAAKEIEASVKEQRQKHFKKLLFNSDRVALLADQTDFVEEIVRRESPEEPEPKKKPTTMLSLDTYFTQRQLQVLQLRGDGLTLAEISEELGITLGSVQKHYHEAKRKAKKREESHDLQLAMCF